MSNGRPLSAHEVAGYLVARFAGPHAPGSDEGTTASVTLQVAGLELVVTLHEAGAGELRMEIDPGGALPQTVDIGAETALTRLARWLGRDDFELGDEETDEALALHGTTEELLEVLRPGIPQRLVRAVEDHGLELGSGRGFARVRAPSEGGRGSIDAEEVVLLIRDLCADQRPPFERLVDTVSQADAPALRRAAYSILLRDHDDDPRLDKLNRALITDPERDLALRAARRLGEEGLPTLEMIVRSTEEGEELREQALVAIADLRKSERAASFLRSSLADSDPWLRHASAEVITQTQDPEFALDLLGALAELGPSWAAPLIEALIIRPILRMDYKLATSLPASPPIQQASILGFLGEIGSAESIAPINAWSEETDDEALAAQAAEVVDRIKRRTSQGDQSVGALSVLDPDEEGRLSLPQQHGAVSLSDPED
ncbi:MAG: hypothetical protein VX498_11610 [Myxococcota bacterium]|nr:hypothetical protein [Myxococcota bacterium]